MIGTTRFGIIVGSSYMDEDGGVAFVEELKSSVHCRRSSCALDISFYQDG